MSAPWRPLFVFLFSDFFFFLLFSSLFFDFSFFQKKSFVLFFIVDFLCYQKKRTNKMKRNANTKKIQEKYIFKKRKQA